MKNIPALTNFETRNRSSEQKTRHISNKPELNLSTVKQKHHMLGIPEYLYLGMEIDYKEIKVITLVIESCVSLPSSSNSRWPISPF